jgi:branched-chain amino acid transport system ATP-binding protein
MLGAYLRNDREAIKEDLEFVYEIFPRLKERASQDATTMSGGEQQMCAIGRGIMSRPRLLMIDELSLGLAPRLVDRLSETLLEINKAGLTILLVEQDVMTAFEIAQHGFVIETGRVSISDTTAALGDNPKIKEAYMGI